MKDNLFFQKNKKLENGTNFSEKVKTIPLTCPPYREGKGLAVFGENIGGGLTGASRGGGTPEDAGV